MILNRSKARGESAITVHAGNADRGMGDIYYSYSENAPANTANGSFHVEADDYELYLKSGFLARSDGNERLTALQTAKIIWNELLERAGITAPIRL